MVRLLRATLCLAALSAVVTIAVGLGWTTSHDFADIRLLSGLIGLVVLWPVLRLLGRPAARKRDRNVP